MRFKILHTSVAMHGQAHVGLGDREVLVKPRLVSAILIFWGPWKPCITSLCHDRSSEKTILRSFVLIIAKLNLISVYVIPNKTCHCCLSNIFPGETLDLKSDNPSDSEWKTCKPSDWDFKYSFWKMSSVTICTSWSWVASTCGLTSNNSFSLAWLASFWHHDSAQAPQNL